MYSKFREAGETFKQFAAQLKILVNDCSNGSPGDMVRDRIIIGVHNSKIQGGGGIIQFGSDWKLENAMQIVARSDELSNAQSKYMAGEDPSIIYNHKKSKSAQKRLPKAKKQY